MLQLELVLEEANTRLAPYCRQRSLRWYCMKSRFYSKMFLMFLSPCSTKSIFEQTTLTGMNKFVTSTPSGSSISYRRPSMIS